MRVLVADDDVVTRFTLKDSLTEWGYEVVEAEDGDEAFRLLRAPDAPQLALVDWSMPGLTGPELCAQLQRHPDTAFCYVILLTARDSQRDIIQGLNSGADDYIAKPHHDDELRARLNVGSRIVKLQNELRRREETLRRNLETQRLNIEQARRLQQYVSGQPPSRIDLSPHGMLVVRCFSRSAGAAGGDHCFIRTRPLPEGGTATWVSLCDQSGHEINCILRGILTDLVQEGVLNERPHASLEQRLAALNDRLCRSGLFEEEEYLTAFTLEIDHQTLAMRYLSCGHPPMLVLRGDEILALPERGSAAVNFPLGSVPGKVFQTGSYALRPGDRLLLYTDGLTEMMVPTRGIRWSTDDLRARVRSLLRAQPDLPVARLIPTLIRTVVEESGLPERPGAEPVLPDDLSVLALELEEPRWTHRVELRPRNAEEVTQALERIAASILEQWRPWQPTEKATMGLRVVLEEAVSNAWRHGNRQVPGQPIEVCWRLHNDLVVEVTDAGAGFDAAAVGDPRREENLLKESGRGVFLIRSLSHYYQWLGSGNRLRFAFLSEPQN